MSFKDLIKNQNLIKNRNNLYSIDVKDISQIIQELEYLEKSIFKDKYKYIELLLNSSFVVFVSFLYFLAIFSLSYIFIF
ncbi:MAG: hypothetical protein ACP5O4_04400 [bacterium]|jgi:hypothetical protein